MGYLFDTIGETYHVCLKILEGIELIKPIRLLGVSVTGLVKESKQLYLFEELEKEKKLNKAVQTINNKFGEFTIKPASLLFIEKAGIAHNRVNTIPASSPLSSIRFLP